MALLVTNLICGTLAFAGPVGSEELPARLPIPTTTDLQGEGHAAPLVGCPQPTDAGLAEGQRIATALQDSLGVRAQVVAADQIAPEDYRQRTVILLGNIATNREILWLYSLGLSFADASYPGADGYVIRQVYDPVGARRNAMIIGASSEEGLKRGVDRFVAEVHHDGLCADLAFRRCKWGVLQVASAAVACGR